MVKFRLTENKPISVVTKSRCKKIVLVIVILLLLAVITIGIILYVNQNVVKKNTSDNTKVCSEEIILAASQAIDDYDLTKQREIANQITSKEGYAGDLDCGYILARYYISTRQKDLALESIDSIKKEQEAGRVYSGGFTIGILGSEELELLAGQIDKGSFSLPMMSEPPPPEDLE